RRDHHRRGVGARLLADAATRAAGRVFTSCRRRGDGEESIRVPGRRLMSESERDPIERQGEQMLQELGEDAHREGRGRAPARVTAAMRYLTSGYAMNPNDILNDALFVEDYDEMVVVKDIDMTSLCEHHLLPFVGKCHVAYMPRKKIVGLSKIPRLVDMYARRL